MTNASNSSTSSIQPRAARIRVWDLPVCLFHWLLVGTVLIAFRLIWGFIGGAHARFADSLKPNQIAHHIISLLSGEPERSIGYAALGGLAAVALIGAFIRGTKRADFHGGIGNARPPALLALPVAAIVIAGSAYGIIKFDSLAFTPGAHVEASERIGGSEKGERDND